MPDIVGQDTIIEGDLPERVANYTSLAAHAAKTQEDWEDELRLNEENRWGSNGFLGGMFEGLAEGKPFIAAFIEALIQEAFPDYDEAVATVENAFDQFAAQFNGKWRDIVNAKNAADYANAQLAVSTRPIKDLFDSDAGDLSGNWTVSYFDSVGGLAGGEIQEDGEGNCWWDGFGNAARTGRARFNAVTTSTDDQIVTTVMPLKVQPPALFTAQSALRLLGRMNSAGDEYVYAEITDDSVALGYRIGSSFTEFDSVATATADGDVWDFYTEGSLLTLKRNGVVILDYDDTAGAAEKDSSHRYVGFEMFAASRGLLGQTSPGVMAVFSADDY